MHADLDRVAGVRDAGKLLQGAARDDRLELWRVAADLGLLDCKTVRVGRGHHDLAAVEAHEDAGQHRARLVTRGGASDAMNRLEQRLAIDRERLHRVELGEAREVVRVVHVERVARTARGDVRDRFCGLVFDRDLVRRQQPHDVGKCLPRQDDRSVAFDLRLDVRPERELHVGGCQAKLLALRVEQDAREDLYRGAGRDGPRHDAECLDEIVLGSGDPETRAH